MYDVKAAFAENLQTLRKKARLTQSELAEKLNYSDKAVSKWERAEAVPDVGTVKEIADTFGVTVDWLLETDHGNDKTYSQRQKTNRLVISLLAAALVWLIATIVFVCFEPLGLDMGKSWLVFVYSVPVSSIVLLVFNSIWGKAKHNFVLITVLVWSLLASLYLSFFTFAIGNVWLVFIIGIPSQIIIVLWSKLRIGKVGKK